MKQSSFGIFVAGLVFMATLATTTTSALAQSTRACSDYAHSYASRNAVGTGLIGGGAIGALGGAILGGAVAGSAGVGTGAAIGGGVGAVIGAHSPLSYRALYNSAYRRCINGRAVSYSGRPAPWTPAWYRYCSSKYHSFNPKTGRFLAYSGHYKMCR